VAKILQHGKNRITEPVPVYGFGLGATKTKAKGPATKMAHGFAIAVAGARAAELNARQRNFSKMMAPRVANDKTKELLTVKLQNDLYLSVVQHRFDIVIVCK
jgi:hypothetical protein